MRIKFKEFLFRTALLGSVVTYFTSPSYGMDTKEDGGKGSVNKTSQTTHHTTSTTLSTKESESHPQTLENPETWCKQGLLLMKGQDAEQNYDEALKLFQKAATQNRSEAQYYIGQIYLYSFDEAIFRSSFRR